MKRIVLVLALAIAGCGLGEPDNCWYVTYASLSDASLRDKPNGIPYPQLIMHKKWGSNYNGAYFPSMQELTTFVRDNKLKLCAQEKP